MSSTDKEEESISVKDLGENFVNNIKNKVCLINFKFKKNFISDFFLFQLSSSRSIDEEDSKIESDKDEEEEEDLSLINRAKETAEKLITPIKNKVTKCQIKHFIFYS